MLASYREVKGLFDIRRRLHVPQNGNRLWTLSKKVERAEAMGEWMVVEYRRSSGRRVKLWSFPSFSDAEAFRVKREEFYRTIGLEKKRAFTPALPKISGAEMELFKRIIENPEWMKLVIHQFVG